MTEPDDIPVCRPLLPDAESVTPYLRRIDEARFYTNHGPLSNALQSRFCERFGLPEGGAISAASGSLALIGAILGHAGRASADRPVCLTTAFGFVASAAAVTACGYQGRFVDIEADGWMLNPDQLSQRDDLDRVGLVLPVAPYGVRIDVAAWAAFQDKTGVPVVIDAAASVDTLELPDDAGGPPVCISLHATKALGIGEGGLILCRDLSVSVRCEGALNNGFMGSRTSRMPNINGKLSEYHAAMGMATLDQIHDIHGDWDRVAADYRDAVSAYNLSTPIHTAPGVSRAYCLAEFSSQAACDAARGRLSDNGVQTRRWYGPGLHLEPAYQDFARDALPHTESLAGRLLGLPMARDLSSDQINRVIALLAESEAA